MRCFPASSRLMQSDVSFWETLFRVSRLRRFPVPRLEVRAPSPLWGMKKGSPGTPCLYARMSDADGAFSVMSYMPRGVRLYRTLACTPTVISHCMDDDGRLSPIADDCAASERLRPVNLASSRLIASQRHAPQGVRVGQSLDWCSITGKKPFARRVLVGADGANGLDPPNLGRSGRLGLDGLGKANGMRTRGGRALAWCHRFSC